MKVIKFILLLTFALISRAHAASCAEQPVVKQIRSEINFDVRNEKLCQTLTTLKTVRMKASRFKSKMNRGLLAKGYWPYLRTQGLKAIEISNSPSCKGIYGFVDQARKPWTISLCPLFFDKSVSVPDRMQLILHEARHFSGHPHVECTRGTWKGVKGGCDEAITNEGSYAVSAESMARLGMRARNLSAAARANAKLLALSYAQNRFNQPVFTSGARAVYLASDEQEKGFFFDGKNFYPAPYVEDAYVVSRTSAVDVFPKYRSEPAYVLNLYSSTHAVDEKAPKGTLPAEYNRLSPSERPEVIDIVTTGEFLCFVQPHQLDCSTSGKKKASIWLEKSIERVFTPEDLKVKPARHTLYIVDREGKMILVRLKTNGESSVSEVLNPIGGIKGIAQLKATRFGLRKDGILMMEKSGRWAPVPNAEGARFDSLSRPFIWSPQLISGE